MHTYLIWCGIALNILLALAIIFGTISEIRAWIYNKKMAVKQTLKQAQFEEELALAKQVWQEWAKQLAEFEQNCAKETDPYKKLRMELGSASHIPSEYYYFASINAYKSLWVLSRENNWVIQNDNLN